MSNINKQALREAAEKANPEQYGYYLIDAFTDLATPATVLALLDELEAKDKTIGFLKDQLAQLANFNPDWDMLEAATDSLREHMSELTAARARIAELEAREVKLPDVEKWRSPEAVRAQNAYRVSVRQELSAAGIITKVGE